MGKWYRRSPAYRAQKRYRQGVQEYAKESGRNLAKYGVAAGPYVIGATAAVATWYLGPLGGAAVTAAAWYPAQYVGATAAREEGKKGKDAREAGRESAEHVMIGGAIGTAVATGALYGWYGEWTWAALGSAAGSLGSAAGPVYNAATAPEAPEAPEGGQTIVAPKIDPDAVMAAAGAGAGGAGDPTDENPFGARKVRPPGAAKPGWGLAAAILAGIILMNG